MRLVGTGTEQIEQDLRVVFPEARLLRMDRDTLHGKHALSEMQQKIHRHEVDIVIVPAFMRQNLTLAEFETFGSRETDWPELVRFTAPFVIAGTPTLSLPSGFNGDGAPFGFQLAAGHLNESGLTRAGHVYQQATSWHRQRPQQLPS